MIMIRTVKSKQQHFPAVPSSRVVKRRIYATCITIIFGIEKICAAATWAGVCVGSEFRELAKERLAPAKVRPGHYKIHIYISIINISNRFIGSWKNDSPNVCIWFSCLRVCVVKCVITCVHSSSQSNEMKITRELLFLNFFDKNFSRRRRRWGAGVCFYLESIACISCVNNFNYYNQSNSNAKNWGRLSEREPRESVCLWLCDSIK
jgi:hypothetical protein